MRKKIRFYKAMIIEILETLCSICLFLESEGRINHVPHYVFMRDHFNSLKEFSRVMREEMHKNGKAGK